MPLFLLLALTFKRHGGFQGIVKEGSQLMLNWYHTTPIFQNTIGYFWTTIKSMCLKFLLEGTDTISAMRKILSVEKLEEKPIFFHLKRN